MKFLILAVFIFSQSVLADEADAIKAANKSAKAKVERVSKGVLKLMFGKREMVLRDNGEDGEGYSAFEFIKYYPQDFYLVRHHYYEGGIYYLYQIKGGQKFKLEGQPVFSESGKVFAFANVDLEAGYTDNVMGVYELEDGRWSKIFSKGDSGKGYPVKNLKWHSDTKLSFTEVNKASQKVILEKAKRQWTLSKEAGP